MEAEILGNITLVNDDCMNFLHSLSDNAFDLAIVDPPYFAGPNKRQYYGSEVSIHQVRRVKYNVIEKWDIPTIEYWTELRRVSKNQIIWGINYFEFAGLASGGRIVWDKCNGDSSFSDCELAYCSFHESVRMFRYMWNGMMQGKNMDEGHIMQGNKRLNEKRIHPTQKPVALYKWLLAKYAKQGDKILDTHLGSASIAIACYDGGFELTGVEYDKAIYDNAVDRIQHHKQQLRLSI